MTLQRYTEILSVCQLGENSKKRCSLAIWIVFVKFKW